MRFSEVLHRRGLRQGLGQDYQTPIARSRFRGVSAIFQEILDAGRTRPCGRQKGIGASSTCLEVPDRDPAQPTAKSSHSTRPGGCYPSPPVDLWVPRAFWDSVRIRPYHECCNRIDRSPGVCGCSGDRQWRIDVRFLNRHVTELRSTVSRRYSPRVLSQNLQYIFGNRAVRFYQFDVKKRDEKSWYDVVDCRVQTLVGFASTELVNDLGSNVEEPIRLVASFKPKRDCHVEVLL